ncbi:hypothetical protein QF026_007556 [Streptomyces aurantiacus]|nr:hypothetical protein [Streptomyces aurantiacus]
MGAGSGTAEFRGAGQLRESTEVLEKRVPPGTSPDDRARQKREINNTKRGIGTGR